MEVYVKTSDSSEVIVVPVTGETTIAELQVLLRGKEEIPKTQASVWVCIEVPGNQPTLQHPGNITLNGLNRR